MAYGSGTKIGTYEILSMIGAGGMGEVYCARDSRLKREVAIKVLPDEFSADPERIEQFQREAEALAALNHYNIAGIHDVLEYGNSRCLVMELVDGDTLEDLLNRGPLPVDDALKIAAQIADALEAAHEKGVIHRDLKPGNIKITPDGKAKLLDFGLARLLETKTVNPGLSNSPTILTQSLSGQILGTAAYMSPEQARGQRADRQSDIWAFGCVLYEMLTRRQAFAGETLTDILGRIVAAEPDFSRLPEETSFFIRDLLRRTLQKDRHNRLRDIGDARIEIERVLNGSIEPPVAASNRMRERLFWIGAVLLAAIGAIYAARVSVSRPDLPELRLQIVTPPGVDPDAFAVSSDGQQIAYSKNNQIFLRSLDSEQVRELAAPGGRMFWFPDSRSIGFSAGPQFKRMDIASGLTETFASAPAAQGGAANKAETILFAPSSEGPLYRVGRAGSDAVQATWLDPPRQVGHRYPRFLPDDRHFVFFVHGTAGGIYLGSLDSKQTRRLFEADTAAVFAEPNYLLFGREEALLAQALDLHTLELVSNAVPVAARLAVDPTTTGDVALSAGGGVIAYRPSAGTRQLVWVDRAGRELGTLGPPDAGEPGYMRMSPDGRMLSLRRTVNGNTDIWLMETAKQVLNRFTLDRGLERYSLWSSDSKKVMFTSDRGGVFDIYEKPVGGGGEIPIFQSDQTKTLDDWSSDGRFIVYTVQTEKTGRDIWALPLFGDRKPFPLVQTPFEDGGLPRFSPDGRWISYTSRESGREQVYVQTFPEPAAKIQVSSNGGSAAQWNSDGKELYYVSADFQLMAVPISIKEGKLNEALPQALFSLAPAPAGSQYLATPDRQRFIVNKEVEILSPITVLVNWKPPSR
jgi:eukaryotic-like serine/threonine-protein kinase